jgi:acetyl-CoA acetyltransferase
MGIGPVPAIRLLLQRSGLSLDDIGRFEINEAQAAQVLAVVQELELDSGRSTSRAVPRAGASTGRHRPAPGHDPGPAIARA